MITVFRRLIEMILCSVILSAAMRGAMTVQIVNSTAQGIGIAFFIGMVIFVALQVFLLRRSYFEAESRREYIIYNLTAYFIFAVVSMGTRIIFGTWFHTWTFGIYKFMMFANADMTWWQSAIYGHAVMVAVIFLAPIGIPAWRVYSMQGAFEEEEIIIPHELLLDPEDEEFDEFDEEDDYIESSE